MVGRVTASAARRIRILFNEFSGSQIVVHEFSETKVVREMVGEQCKEIDVHGGCLSFKAKCFANCCADGGGESLQGEVRRRSRSIGCQSSENSIFMEGNAHSCLTVDT